MTNIRGIKVAYPSTGADLKGLMKSAFYDPNPVVMLEHKGLYWSKIKGTEGAITVEPSEDYVVPFGKARLVQEADPAKVAAGESLVVVTYGRGVYWSIEAAQNFEGQIEIIDLRTLSPWDEETVFAAVNKHSKCVLVTEESIEATFTLSIAAKIQKNCFKQLDAPIEIVGSVDTPAIPLNSILEATLLTNAEKVAEGIEKTLNF